MPLFFYIEQLLSQEHTLINYNTPAMKEFFQVTTESQMLNEEANLHMILPKLLYLAKCARPNLLTATSFLCTRVKQPTKVDQRKLIRV
jgi:hypothetical protein